MRLFNVPRTKQSSGDGILTQPSQLRTIFGVFAISFAVKLRVSIAQL